MRYRQPSDAPATSLALCLLFAALSGACTAPEPRTQVMLIIDADSEVQTLATQLAIDIESRSEFDHIDGAPTKQTFEPMDASEWPFSIALVPQGRDARRSYRLTITLSDAAGPIARLRAHSGFVAQATLALRLRFSAACLRAASLVCRDQETCFDGACVSALIDAQSLPLLSGGIANGFAPADGGSGEWMPATSGTRQPALMTGAKKADGGTDAAPSGGMSNPPKPGSGGKDSMNKPGSEPMAPGDCGDGRVDSGELCDTAIPPGESGACPSECPVEDPCMPSQLEGSGCLTQCMVYAITSLESGDGCCLMGTDANSDNDCAAACGNGIVEMGETCDPVESCPNPTTCTNANACLRATIAGDAASCTATCLMQPIEECLAGDGCCPSTCSHDTDSDCSASCGNGVVDVSAGETCEADSTTQPCPTSCDDAMACTGDYSTGSVRNCNLACTHVDTLLPIIADGCCPAGANANNDTDCQPMCGNQIVERGERCDGRCPTQTECNDGNPCTRDAVAGSGCNVMCTHVLINAAMSGDSCCPAGANATNDGDCQPVCGNKVRETGELCDGDCPTTGASCTDDTNVCTMNVVVGTGCQRECRNQQATAGAADGCCLDPGTMNSSTDPDCPDSCGNGRPDPGETCDADCPATCDGTDMDPCTDDVLSGPRCNVVCIHTRKTTSPSGDRCCLDGPSADDTDCPTPDPMCGNGMIEDGEDCDRDCPPCDDNNDCTTDMRPVPCRKACENTPKVASGPRIDMCCPTGADANEDSDCVAICGNLVKEPGELCDPCKACDDQNPCTRDIETGTPPCNVRCEHDPITSPATGDSCCPDGANEVTDKDCNPRCGNGVVESGEDCDEVSMTCSGCRLITTDPTPPQTARAATPE